MGLPSIDRGRDSGGLIAGFERAWDSVWNFRVPGEAIHEAVASLLKEAAEADLVYRTQEYPKLLPLLPPVAQAAGRVEDLLRKLMPVKRARPIL